LDLIFQRFSHSALECHAVAALFSAVVVALVVVVVVVVVAVVVVVVVVAVVAIALRSGWVGRCSLGLSET